MYMYTAPMAVSCEQSLRVAAWLEHGQDLSDASPREPNLCYSALKAS